MARDTFENWIPDEVGSKPVTEFQQTSAVDSLTAGRHEVMASDVKRIPRDGGFTVGPVAKGSAYTESTSTNDYVELTARKIGGAERVAEEDLTDPTVDVLETKRIAAANAMARFFDNAALATTAAVNGTTVLYQSVYNALKTTQAGIPGGTYTANDNYAATAGLLTYDQLSAALGLVESSTWADENGLYWIGHPAFKGYLRGLKNTQGDPIWREGVAGASPDTILGYPVRWSRGAKTSATNTQAPTGNPLLFVGDPAALKVGDAKLPGVPLGGMGSQLQRAATGIGFLTDEAIMKAAMRKGFALAHPTAWAVIEKTAS
jgi:HK97 family phage major capsid protein